MTTEQASKLKRGQVVDLDERRVSIGAGRRITVENSQIRLSDMAVILTTAAGEEIICNANSLELVH